MAAISALHGSAAETRLLCLPEVRRLCALTCFKLAGTEPLNGAPHFALLVRHENRSMLLDDA